MPYMLPLLNMQAPPHSKNSKPQHQQMMRMVSISILVMSLPVLYVSFLHVPPAALFRDTTFWFLMSNSIIIVIAADSGMLFFRSSSCSSSVDDADSDGGGLPFVVSGGEPAAFKSGHVITGVSVADEVVMPLENQGIMVLREREDDVTMVAENDHAYALVLRDDHGERRMASESASESRDTMVVTPASSDLAGEAVSVWNEGGAMVRENKPGLSLTASRSPAREQRLRRRHSHRPSHSRALVPVQDKSVVVTEEKQLRRTATEGRPSAAEEKESEYSRLSDDELNRRVEEFITKFNREMRLQLEREQLALAAA